MVAAAFSPAVLFTSTGCSTVWVIVIRPLPLQVLHKILHLPLHVEHWLTCSEPVISLTVPSATSKPFGSDNFIFHTPSSIAPDIGLRSRSGCSQLNGSLRVSYS